MKIGILTFHAQINYGGILQCYALQEILKKMGYEPVVIDRWFSDDNIALNPFIDYSFKGKIKRFIRTLWGNEENERIKRYETTRNFISRYLNLTSFSFCLWKDAPKTLGVDLIIVGSDQVWNGTWQDPGVFLLEGAPKVPALSYAASFGMSKLPETLRNRYRDGFSRFLSLSVREEEGKSFLESLGFHATVVVDPTQLLSSDDWIECLKIKSISQQLLRKTSKRIVCYFISEDLYKVLPLLVEYAEKYECKVDILLQTYTAPSMPKSIKAFVDLFLAKVRHNRVRLRLSAGPREFVELFSDADTIISDSFHALMFASIFNKNVRVIRPSELGRAMMFARIEEFVKEYVVGNPIADNLSEALEFLDKKVEYNFMKLDCNRKQSFQWLSENIKKQLK